MTRRMTNAKKRDYYQRKAQRAVRHTQGNVNVAKVLSTLLKKRRAKSATYIRDVWVIYNANAE